MKPTKSPGPEYLPAGFLDMSGKKAAVAINLVGVLALFVFGWLFYQAALTIRPDILAPSSFLLLGGPELLALIAGLVGVILLHELIHGLFFWLFTRERFQLGIRPFYAFAASPAWFIPRGHFTVIGLAPLILISLVGLGLISLVSLPAASLILVTLVINAAGSTGDLIVVGWILAGPRGRLVRDQGTSITIYEPFPQKIADMKGRWTALLATYGVKGEALEIEFVKLIKQYNTGNRYYHNLEHIRAILDTITALEPYAEDYRALQLAAWYHDVIYEPEKRDNEEKSADYSYHSLIDLDLAEEVASRVRELILVTADHHPPNGDIDAQILVDADLAPLAIDEEQFKRHAFALRQEFAQIPEDEFNASRKEFLTQIINREQIFKTEQLHGALEEKARENIKQSLAALP